MKFLAIALLAMVLLSIESKHLHFNKNKSRNTPQPSNSTAASPPPKKHGWGYHNQTSDAWAVGDCAVNSRPSPVNLIIDAPDVCMDDFYIGMDQSEKFQKSNLEDNGHTIEMKGHWDDLYAFVDGEYLEYNALQFHFHSPSEHTVNGEHFDLEMHIVHKLDKHFKGFGDGIAVAAFFFNVGPDNEPNSFFDFANGGFDVNTVCKKADCPPPKQYGQQDLVFDNFYYDGSGVYYYKGSFTTPPCSQIASWFINAEPQPISKEQLQSFTKHWSENPNFAGNADHIVEPQDWIGNNRATQGDVTPTFFSVDCYDDYDGDSSYSFSSYSEDSDYDYDGDNGTSTASTTNSTATTATTATTP